MSIILRIWIKLYNLIIQEIRDYSILFEKHIIFQSRNNLIASTLQDKKFISGFKGTESEIKPYLTDNGVL